MYDKKDTIFYESGFYKGMFQGFGIVYSNGEKEYEGLFSNGKPNGNGILHSEGQITKRDLIKIP